MMVLSFTDELLKHIHGSVKTMLELDSLLWLLFGGDSVTGGATTFFVVFVCRIEKSDGPVSHGVRPVLRGIGTRGTT
jgi:hypothetical protein